MCVKILLPIAANSMRLNNKFNDDTCWKGDTANAIAAVSKDGSYSSEPESLNEALPLSWTQNAVIIESN